jgi:hypothetical protein
MKAFIFFVIFIGAMIVLTLFAVQLTNPAKVKVEASQVFLGTVGVPPGGDPTALTLRIDSPGGGSATYPLTDNDKARQMAHLFRDGERAQIHGIVTHPKGGGSGSITVTRFAHLLRGRVEATQGQDSSIAAARLIVEGDVPRTFEIVLDDKGRALAESRGGRQVEVIGRVMPAGAPVPGSTGTPHEDRLIVLGVTEP